MSNKEYFNKLSRSEFFERLFQSRDIIHLCHLATNSFAEHEALDDYYKGIIELTDALVEMYQGKYGIIDMKIPASEKVNAIEYLEGLGVYVDNNKILFTESWILNQIDSISELIYSTLYKLKNLI